MEKTNAMLRIAYGACRMEVATVPASILVCSPFDSIVPHELHVATLGQAVDAAAEIPYAIALPFVGRVAHRERSERCDGWGAASASEMSAHYRALPLLVVPLAGNIVACKSLLPVAW